MALVISLIGLIITIVLLIKSRNKDGTIVNVAVVSKDQTRNVSIPLSAHVNTKKNIAYVVHSPKLDIK